MALTLPYPSLSFVPLDVLTAEEMNEIVANYTYIANQFPIGTSNIASNAVTYGKIDWSTFQPSTTERVVGKWTDGRNVYEQAFTGTVPTITANTLSQTVLAEDIDAIVDVAGFFSWTNTHTVPVGEATYLRMSDGTSILTCVVVNNSRIELRCFNSSSSYTNRPYSVVVRYLKSN